MTGMLMSERITISCGPMPAATLVDRFLTRIREMQDIGALARLAAKLLAEQFGNIGLVIDNQDADAHECTFACEARPSRGSRTVNSVKTPSSLLTAIAPPCCCVTIS